MPIKDNRAGLVRELEETAFLPLLFKVSFFLSEVWSRLEFSPLNNCWPFYVIKGKGGVDWRTAMMNSTPQAFFVFCGVVFIPFSLLDLVTPLD